MKQSCRIQIVMLRGVRSKCYLEHPRLAVFVPKVRSTVLLALMCALSVFFVGCVPIPTSSVIHYGVKASLRDAGSKQPLDRRQIVVKVDAEKFSRKTDRNGEFRIGSASRHYFTWLGGPIYPSPAQTTIEITCDGYVNYRETAVVISMSPGAQKVEDKSRLVEKCILLGNVDMTKSQKEESATSPLKGGLNPN